jgi:Flp pilus assembly CpaE family ATPase
VSIKGGVGRSILSYHLALQLNAYTKSEPLLIDACVPLGSAKALLHIEPKVSWQVLRPLLKTGKDLTANRLASQVTKTNWQFHLLCAPSEWNEESLSASELGNLLHTARESFPITIVDLPSVKPSEFMEYARHFDLLIWVFTPDATSIQHTLELQAQLNKETLDKDIKKPQMLFVCNMYEPSFDATLIKSVGSKLAQLKVFLIDADPEAVKTHQRKFELLSDDTLLLTSQIKELAKHAFFTLTGI